MSDLTVEEQTSQIKVTKTMDNAVVLANVIELSAGVIIKIAGKDVADTLNNQTLNRAVLSNLVANRIKEKILSK